MPQNLQDTEYPGSAVRVAVLLLTPQSKDLIAIAPVYSRESLQHAIERAQALGFTLSRSEVPIYSVDDLDRIKSGEINPQQARHEAGCIFANQNHPGECYVESSDTQ